MINIKQFDVKHLLEVNLDLEIQKHTIDDLYYITIDNFFKNPKDLIKFLECFPADDYEKRLKNDNLRNDEKLLKRPCGIQQLLHNGHFEVLSIELIKLLEEANFIPHDENLTYTPEKMFNQIKKLVYYTNFLSPESVNYKGNNYPHIDIFEYAYNFHLSENVGGGLAFYKFKYNNKYYSDITSILKEPLEDRTKIRDLLNTHEEEKFNHEKIEKFKNIKENKYFQLYHTCEYKFNRLIIHEGKYWHGIDYDSNKEKYSRYSLVGAYNHHE